MEFAESATTRSEASARGASKPSSRSLAAVELQLFSIAAELVPSALRNLRCGLRAIRADRAGDLAAMSADELKRANARVGRVRTKLRQAPRRGAMESSSTSSPAPKRRARRGLEQEAHNMRLAGHIGATPPRRRQRPRQLRISGPPLPPQVDDGTRHRARQARGVGPFVPQTLCMAADRSPPTAIATALRAAG